jgi:hypothetical protein
MEVHAADRDGAQGTGAQGTRNLQLNDLLRETLVIKSHTQKLITSHTGKLIAMKAAF